MLLKYRLSDQLCILSTPFKLQFPTVTLLTNESQRQVLPFLSAFNIFNTGDLKGCLFMAHKLLTAFHEELAAKDNEVICWIICEILHVWKPVLH